MGVRQMHAMPWRATAEGRTSGNTAGEEATGSLIASGSIGCLVCKSR